MPVDVSTGVGMKDRGMGDEKAGCHARPALTLPGAAPASWQSVSSRLLLRAPAVARAATHFLVLLTPVATDTSESRAAHHFVYDTDSAVVSCGCRSPLQLAESTVSQLDS